MQKRIFQENKSLNVQNTENIQLLGGIRKEYEESVKQITKQNNKESRQIRSLNKLYYINTIQEQNKYYKQVLTAIDQQVKKDQVLKKELKRAKNYLMKQNYNYFIFILENKYEGLRAFRLKKIDSFLQENKVTKQISHGLEIVLKKLTAAIEKSISENRVEIEEHVKKYCSDLQEIFEKQTRTNYVQNLIEAYFDYLSDQFLN